MGAYTTLIEVNIRRVVEGLRHGVEAVAGVDLAAHILFGLLANKSLDMSANTTLIEVNVSGVVEGVCHGVEAAAGVGLAARIVVPPAVGVVAAGA